MRRQDTRPVSWLARYGCLRAPVSRYRCPPCQYECRPLLDLLGELPSSETRSTLRSQWSNFGMRDALLLRFAQEPEPCRVSTCESMAEFFVFDPTTNDEVAHVCMGCFEQATKGAATGTAAYFSRFEAIMGEEQPEQAGDVANVSHNPEVCKG